MDASIHNLTERRYVKHPNLERWVTTQELADHLRFSTKWVQRRVKDGMPHERLGGRLRFKITLVEQWLREQAKARNS